MYCAENGITADVKHRPQPSHLHDLLGRAKPLAHAVKTHMPVSSHFRFGGQVTLVTRGKEGIGTKWSGWTRGSTSVPGGGLEGNGTTFPE